MTFPKRNKNLTHKSSKLSGSSVSIWWQNYRARRVKERPSCREQGCCVPLSECQRDAGGSAYSSPADVSNQTDLLKCQVQWHSRPPLNRKQESILFFIESRSASRRAFSCSAAPLRRQNEHSAISPDMAARLLQLELFDCANGAKKFHNTLKYIFLISQLCYAC